MSLDQFIAKYSGQSVLYNQRDPSLRGQCVQLVCFYVQEVVGKPVIWNDAAEWWYSGLFPEHYERIANSATAVPRPGDIIVWDRSLANSGGAGHIAICVTPRPGTGTFVSFDSNWGGKTAKLVTHNYNKVVGWLRPRVPQPAPAPAPAPQPKPQQGGDEMIANADQARKIYKMLRPNGDASEAEINGTAGRRSFASFLNDAQAEINARDNNLREQAQRVVDLTSLINSQNQTITELTQKLQNSDATAAEKTKALNDALAELGRTNAELATARDELKDLQEQSVITSQPLPDPKVPLLVRLLSLFIKKKS